MGDLTLITFDWVPSEPRGFVRDLRIRWALEEGDLPYTVTSVPFHDRDVSHLRHQPFNRVPWLTDGTLSVFESGAILLHLAERCAILFPEGADGRSRVVQWVFAALNSVEAASLPLAILKFADVAEDDAAWQAMKGFLTLRLDRIEPVLSSGNWIAGRFCIADILMADVLRMADHFGWLEAHPACRAYVARATARPAFVKAYDDQMAHFARAD